MKPADTTQIGFVRGRGVGDGGVPRVAVGVVAQPTVNVGTDAAVATSAAAAVTVGADGDDAGRVVADGGFEQGLRASSRCRRPAPPPAPVRSGALGAAGCTRRA